ncbi:MAG: DUF975 family protein [Thomasclavelia sp.]
MNVRDIKTKARSTFGLNRSNIMTVFIFVAVTLTVIQYLTDLIGNMIPLFSLLAGVIIAPLYHGNIVTALKTVNERGDEISIEQDGLAGFKRYRELFFTYFIRELFLGIIILFVIIIGALIAKFSIGDVGINNIISLFNEVSKNGFQVSAYLNDPVFAVVIDQLRRIIVLGTIVILVIMVMYSLCFALTPYILEKYNVKGIKAMSESLRLMKGHKGTLFVLYLSYIGWYFLAVLLLTAVTMIIPVTIIVNLIAAIITTYLFSAELNVCLAVFYEEIDLEDKNIV